MRTRVVPSLGAALMLAGHAQADTSDVTWQNRVVIEKQGAHCVDDPNCFDRYRPVIEPVARAQPGDHIVIGQVVDVPNYTVSTILDLEVFEEE